MPLPTLNTEGIDVSNTLYKIMQMKQMEQHSQNAQASNALHQQQLKHEETQAQSALMENYIKGLSIVRPDEWKAFRNYFKGQGVPDFLMPKETAFEKEPDANGKVVPDSELFTKHRDFIVNSYHEAKNGKKFKQETIYNIDGRTLSIPIPEGGTVDPEIVTGEKGWSFKAPDKKTISEYTTFYDAGKKAGKTDAQMDAEWEHRKIRIARESRPPRAEGDKDKPSNRKKEWMELNADLKAQGKPGITLEQYIADETERSGHKPVVRKPGAISTTTAAANTGRAFLSPDGKTITFSGKIYPVDADGTFTLDGKKMRVKK